MARGRTSHHDGTERTAAHKPKPALSPEQESVIALIDRRKALLRRANNLLAKGHDQGYGSIDLVLGQLFARKDIILGVAVPDHIGEAPGQHRITS